MVYAPVIIPTLNRYEHFRRCLESLDACTGAAETEIYIGLDYPPKEKYKDGWGKIDAYLCEKEKKSNFKKLVVFRRKKNCGVTGSASNASLLRNYVENIYDRYIFTEDDNIFSPNFLEYVNKGLEKYKDDPTIYAVCGYCHYPIYDFKYSDNNFFFHNTDFAAWGYGTWTEKRSKLLENVKEKDFFRNHFRWKTALNIFKKHGSYRCIQYFSASFNYGLIRMHDGVYSAYMQVNGMNVVVPAVSKVRNIGWDNYGLSFVNGMNRKYFNQGKKYSQQKIDSEVEFEFKGEPWSFYEYNNMVAAKNNVNNKSAWYLLKAIPMIILKYYIKKVIRYGA